MKKYRYTTEVHTLSQSRKSESQNEKILRFETMTEKWLDFIANCRTGHPQRPTHQISFHTTAALQTIRFIGGEKVYG